MRKTMGARELPGIALVAGVVVLAGCGGGKSSSTTGATAAQSVKRLEVTVVGSGTAAAPGTRPFLAWAKELLGWVREAEAAVCTVSAAGQTASTDAGGKATLVNVPVVNGNILVTINCNGVVSTVNISATPGTVLTVVVAVGPGRVEVRARNEHVSEPSVSTPSPVSRPTQTSSGPGSNSGKK